MVDQLEEKGRMKPLQDDVYSNSQFKQPFVSPLEEQYGQSHVPGDGVGEVVGGAGGGSSARKQKLTTNNALTYLKEVNDTFHGQREKYDMFLDLLKDFKAQRIDTTSVVATVAELFEGHDNLIFGFSTFLPKGYEITVIDDDEESPSKKTTVEFEEAISFVDKIKKRFQNDNHVYESFLDILNMYQKEHKGINEVYHEVAVLFDDQPDLLDEFTRYLPEASAVATAHRASLGRHIKTMKPEKESRDRRNSDQDYKEADLDTDRDMHRVKKRKYVCKVADFGVHSDDKDALKNMYSQEFTFCEKVKDRLRNHDEYQAFLKCLHIHSTEIITTKELLNLVSELFKEDPDLMEGFNLFLERCENIDGFLACVMEKKSSWTEGHVSKPTMAEDKKREHRHEIDAAKDDRYDDERSSAMATLKQPQMDKVEGSSMALLIAATLRH